MRDRQHRASNSVALSIARAAIDECASLFNQYSVDELQGLDHETLHRLLSSESL
jgi:hypothetical protein